MRTISAPFVTLAALLFGSLPGLAGAQRTAAPESEAGAHFEAARGAIAGAQYQAALGELEAAAALVPSPVLDYYFGIAHEGLGHDAIAVDHYRRYLAAFPAAPERVDIEERITRLEGRGAPEMVPPRQSPPTVVVMPYPQPPAADYVAPAPAVQKRHSHWWIVFPIIGGALVLTLAVGVALVIAGGSPATDPGHSYEHHWWDLNAQPAANHDTALFRF